MRRIGLLSVVAFLFTSAQIRAQGTILESFDNLSADSLVQVLTEGHGSYFHWSENSTDKVQGVASIDAHVLIDSIHSWGSYSMLIYRLPSNQTMDWSSSDTLRLWIKVLSGPVHAGNMVLRIHVADQDAPGDQIEEWLYENDNILAQPSGWVQIKVPLVARNQTGNDLPDTTGVILAPPSWGMPRNNQQLDLDKIVGWNIAFVSTSNLRDSVEVMLDDFERTGNRPVPFVIFNGIAAPNYLSPFQWGNALYDVVQGAGPVPNSNAIKWTFGDQWGSGWNGIGFNISPPANLSGGWQVDSLKFMMKTDKPGVILRAQFEDGSVHKGYHFVAANDTGWHQYIFPLRDFITEHDGDTTKPFDSSKVTVFQFMTNGDTSGIAGHVAYISNIWTGTPKFNFIPPAAPAAVMAIANNNYSNTIIWNDVPGQSGETYNVYYSFNPITDINSKDVEVVATGIPHGVMTATHILRAPGSDQNVTYYYAVVCRSSSGILGTPGVSAAVTNKAKGVTTIHWGAPTNFVADADLSEWAGIKPFRMYPSDGSGTVVQNTNIKSDTMCSADAYLAVDQNYLYVAFHVNTNNVYYDPNLDKLGQSYLNSCPDLFIGLYDWHGMPHGGLQNGAQPDYHIRFSQGHIRIDNDNVDSLEVYGPNYAWNPARFPDPLAGYNVEARIPWSDLARKSDAGMTRHDSLFVPKLGMRIPIDFEINNVSPGATQRDGQLDYSPVAQGNSWQNVSVWSYTWIGDQWATPVRQSGQKPVAYELDQNYPNPFNPATQIRYSLAKSGMVTLNIYDILGRKVATLVSTVQSAGEHVVTFDGSRLTSGVYFYQLEAGTFRSVKKMILVK
jgi:hypothetical protein